MNKQKFNIIMTHSLMLGGVLGLLACFPYLDMISVLIMSTVCSVILMIYLQNKNVFGELTMKGGAVLGALIGIIALFGFLAVCLPLRWLLGTILFKVIYYTSTKFLCQIWWVFLTVGSIITGLFNSFALMVYVYIKDTFFMINGTKQIENSTIDFFKK